MLIGAQDSKGAVRRALMEADSRFFGPGRFVVSIGDAKCVGFSQWYWDIVRTLLLSHPQGILIVELRKPLAGLSLPSVVSPIIFAR